MGERKTLNPKLDTIEQQAQASAVMEDLQAHLASGREWFPALLQAVGRWPYAEEQVEEAHHHYLLGGEAFDWRLLAQRLCRAVDGLIPAPEREALLGRGETPLVAREEFRQLLGELKYQGVLNHYYGVLVEGALLEAVQAEVRKEQRGRGPRQGQKAQEEACRRLYGAGYGELLQGFQAQAPAPQAASPAWVAEFRYWLFRRRLKASEKARVASDTKKGLAWLQRAGHNPLPFTVP